MGFSSRPPEQCAFIKKRTREALRGCPGPELLAGCPLVRRTSARCFGTGLAPPNGVVAKIGFYGVHRGIHVQFSAPVTEAPSATQSQFSSVQFRGGKTFLHPAVTKPAGALIVAATIGIIGKFNILDSSSKFSRKYSS